MKKEEVGTEVDNSFISVVCNNSGMVENDWNAEMEGSQKLFLYMVQVMLAKNIEGCFLKNCFIFSL
jgi:hypothetical protein